MRHFGEAQSKAIRVYAQNKQYHVIVESCVRFKSIYFLNIFFNHLEVRPIYEPNVTYLINNKVKIQPLGFKKINY